LRIAVYNPATSCAESVDLIGDVALREAAGAQGQHLFGPAGGDGRDAALLYHVARWRTTVVAGVWSEELDR
jgi:hypothetical protein